MQITPVLHPGLCTLQFLAITFFRVGPAMLAAIDRILSALGLAICLLSLPATPGFTQEKQAKEVLMVMNGHMQ